ncbi:hypothetical protein CKO23_02195 [Thiocystis violacea]|nr:hypothetical protein [Thiocystis violacea]
MYHPLSTFFLAFALLVSACTEPAPPTLSLYSAVHTGDLDQVMRHLYWDTDVNQADVNGDYPLHVAARDGRVRIARELVEHGADPQTRDAAGQTAMRVALTNGRTQVAQMLIEHGAALDAQAMLAELVEAGVADRDSFALLLRRGASLNQRDAGGRTLLHLAIAAGQLDTVARLIMLGADVSEPSAQGQRPLTLALELASRGGKDSRDIVDLLERNGAARGQVGATSSPETQGKPE